MKAVEGVVVALLHIYNRKGTNKQGKQCQVSAATSPLGSDFRDFTTLTPCCTPVTLWP
jgi:hypothetical protein